MLTDARLYVQLLMALISLLAVVRYSRYLREELAGRKSGHPAREMPKHLQALMGIPIVYFWFIMPFLPQPLLGQQVAFQGAALAVSAPDFLPQTPVRWMQWGVGLVLGIGGTLQYVRLMKKNLAVTAEDYCRPKQLMTEGIYAKLRHPIVVSRFIGTCGLVLFTGGAYTALLLPVLAFGLWLSAHVEEKEVLYPVFGREYHNYKMAVPGYVCPGVGALLLVLAAGLFAPAALGG